MSSSSASASYDSTWLFISCIGIITCTALHLYDAWIGLLVGWAFYLISILLGMLLAYANMRRCWVFTLEVFFLIMFAIPWGLSFVRPAFGVPSAIEIQIVRYFPFFTMGGLSVFSVLTALISRPWTLPYTQGFVPKQAINHTIVTEMAFLTLWIWMSSSMAACLLYLIPFMLRVELQVKGLYDTRTGSQKGSNPTAVIFGIVVPICAVALSAAIMYFWRPRLDPNQMNTSKEMDCIDHGGGQGQSYSTMNKSLALALPPPKPSWMGGKEELKTKSDIPAPILPFPKSDSSDYYPPLPPNNWAVQPTAPIHFFTDSQQMSQSGLIPSAPGPSTVRYGTGNSSGMYVNELYQQPFMQQPQVIQQQGVGVGAAPFYGGGGVGPIAPMEGIQQQHQAWIGNLLMGAGGVPQGLDQGPVRVGDYRYGGGSGGVSSPSQPMTIHHMHHVFVHSNSNAYNNHNIDPLAVGLVPDQELADQPVKSRRTRTVVD